MKVTKHKVVTIDYTVTNLQGAVIDSSDGSEPFAYIQGTGNIIPGLEQALEGRTQGETLTVSIPPELGYGLRDANLMQVVPRDRFDGIDALEVGMRFHAESDQGERVVTVVAIEGEDVTIDGNHPLAGETLEFGVTVVEVREPSEEELSHGHVHGPGGHHH